LHQPYRSLYRIGSQSRAVRRRDRQLGQLIRRVLADLTEFDLAQRDTRCEDRKKSIGICVQRDAIDQRDKTRSKEVGKANGLVVTTAKMQDVVPDEGSETIADADASAHSPQHIDQCPVPAGASA